MVKHVVCFKLADPSPETCEKTRDILLSMRGKVEQLRKIEVGIDFLHSPRSYDILLEVWVDDRQALDAYQQHPYHVNVVKAHMHAVQQSSVSVDWEC